MEPYNVVLVAIGCIHFLFTCILLSLFLLPFSCFCRQYYMNEPIPRTVKWASPIYEHGYHANEQEHNIHLAPRFHLMTHVAQTELKYNYYTKSISEYAGARGTTAAKLLSVATSIIATLQIVLAILMFVFKNHMFTTIRFICAIIGAFACLMLGQSESALPWSSEKETKQRRKEHVIERLNTPSLANRRLPPARNNTDDKKEKGDEEEAEPHSPSAAGISYHPVQFLRDFFRDSQHNNDKRNDSATAGDVAINKDMIDTQIAIIEDEVARDSVERGEVLYSERQDENAKHVYENIHMISALLLIFANAFSQWFGPDISLRLPSFVMSCVGFAFFFIFAMMQWLSGNYEISWDNRNYNITHCTNIWSSGLKWLRHCYCPQSTWATIDPKKIKSSHELARMGLLFLFVELIAFVLLTSIFSVEAVWLAFL